MVPDSRLQVPNKDFWAALPGLIMAGVGFTCGKLGACGGFRVKWAESYEFL